MAFACLAKVSPLNPSTGSRVDLYIASAQDRAVTGLNGVVWEPAMTASPTLSINLWQGDFRDPVDTGGASFGINMGILKMTYAGCDAYNWAGAPVEIYAEESGTAWPWTRRFKGRIASYSRRVEVLTINASIDVEPFDKNVLTATYAGTGGAEGGSDLKGRLKPLVIGWAKNVEPVLIDTVNNVFQFSGYGAIEEVSNLYERAADFGASVGDYATYAALVAATIPAGRWGTCLAAGMVRLGAPAAGVITGDLKGHKVGATTPRLSGAVISALATISGVSTGDIETATLTSLDAAVPYPINLVLTEQVTFRDMAAGLALACNWQSGITLVGKFFVLSVSLSGSEVITLNAQGTALPQVTSSDEQDVSVPYYLTIFGANRCWRVHTADEIAFTAALVERGTYSATETYREGNIVTTADGARWIYTNPVASSGNAPPTLPTTSNAYWSNMTAASPVAVLGFLTNDTHVVNADASGAVTSWTGAGGTFVVQENGATLSSGVTFSLVSATGVTVSINATTGVYSATAMSASTGTATFRAVYNGVTIDKIFSIAKSITGATGATGSTGATGPTGPAATSAYLTRESAVLFAYADGSVASYSTATGDFKVFAGSTDISSNFALSTVNNPQSLTVSYASRTFTISAGFDPGENSATLTIRATGSGAYAGVTFDKVFTLTKSITGATGATGSTGATGPSGLAAFLTNDSFSVPAYANGTVTTYSGATGSFKVFAGNTDVSSNFTLTTQANPQALTVSYVGQAYTVTGGLDTSEDTASLTIRATGSGSYSGVTIDRVFSLGKNKGGYEIVAALPATNLFEGRVVFLTSDDKLYRYTSGAGWTKNVDTGDLNGQVQYQQIGNGAVRLQHLLITPNNLCPDPQFRDLSLWVQNDESGPAGDGALGAAAVGWYPEEGAAAVGANEAAIGNRFVTLWSGRPGQNNINNRFLLYANEVNNNRAPVAPGTVYELKAGCHNSSNQTAQVILEYYSIAWSYLGDSALSWAAGEIGVKSGQVTPPAGASWARLLLLNGGGSNFAGWIRIGNLFLREAAGATAIIDGSVVAGKVAADAIATNNLQAGAVTAAKVATSNLITLTAQIADAVITNAKIGNLEVSTIKIADGAVTDVTQASNGSTITGNSTWKTVVTMNVVMSQGGDIIAIAALGQSFSSGAQPWSVRLRINGTVVYTTSGAAFADSVSLSGKGAIASAGTITVEIQWNAAVSVSVPAGRGSLVAIRRYK